jgi:toxin HigB-1
MIAGFPDAEPLLIWSGHRSRRLPGNIQPVALRKLRMLNSARRLEDLRIPPANRLEALRGSRKGQYSIRINEIVLGQRAITPDTDLRLARYFGVSEGFFLGLQTDYALMERKRALGDKLKTIRPRAA